MKPAVVIPVTGKLGQQNREDLFNLLSDLEPHKDLFEGIICLFDSTEWVFVQDFRESFNFIKAVWNTGKSFNFSANSNIGLRIAYENGCDAILINQDCRIPDPLSLSNIKVNGICSPYTISDHYESYINREQNSLELIYQDAEKFAFYCTYFSREAMEKVGFLDEAFIKVFSDDDYCLRTHLSGLEVKTVNIPIYHRGSFVKLENESDVSGSGCYNNQDLALGLAQYQAKWNCFNEKHDNIAKKVMENFVWDDAFRCP